MKIERPEGYRAPTDVEMDCLPEGAIWLHGSEGWRASLFVGQQSQDISERYAVPIAPKAKRTSAPTPPHEDCGCVLCIDAHIKKGLLSKPADLDPKGEASNGIVRKAALVDHGTGAKREDKTGRGAFHLIPPIALRSLAKRFEDGAVVHGPSNWHKGIPLSSYKNAVDRHTLQASEGATDEDHFGAALWNLSCWLWTENEIKEGRLPAELNDLPYYAK